MDALVIGPGLGRNRIVFQIVGNIIEEARKNNIPYVSLHFVSIISFYYRLFDIMIIIIITTIIIIIITIIIIIIIITIIILIIIIILLSNFVVIFFHSNFISYNQTSEKY